MSQLVIKINTDNEGMQDAYGIAYVLEQVKTKLNDGDFNDMGFTMPLRDINGNTVGTLDIENDQE